MIKKTYLKSLALTVLSLGMMASVAIAGPITGEIQFGGLWQAVNGGGNSSIVDATGVDWTSVPVVLGSTGDFTSMTTVGGLSFTDFFFKPTLAIAGNLWEADNFSFLLTSVSIDTQTSATLGLYGMGVMSATGFDDTDYSWSFSGQTGLSLSTGNSPVPEPATMLLFGTGLIGLAGVSRSRKKAKK